MNYNSIIFREFTQESLKRIKRYQQEEAERVASEQLEQKTVRDDDNNKRRGMNKLSEDEPIGSKRAPNKELAVGRTLPRLLQNKFPDELIGKPIEEIDCYYRTEYVCIIF
jgi:hypothetical protein